MVTIHILLPLSCEPSMQNLNQQTLHLLNLSDCYFSFGKYCLIILSGIMRCSLFRVIVSHGLAGLDLGEALAEHKDFVALNFWLDLGL